MDEDLLPARMVNEFVYCPRLFYLEWVQGRFADNDYTRVGQQVHRRVDTETGAAPLPDEGELRAARSVMLSSQGLGVIAKLDLITGTDGGSSRLQKRASRSPTGHRGPATRFRYASTESSCATPAIAATEPRSITRHHEDVSALN